MEFPFYFVEADWKLLVIRQRTLVGKIADKHNIYKINKIAVLSLSDADPVDVELEVCSRQFFVVVVFDRF